MTSPIISVYNELSFLHPDLTGILEDVRFNYCLLRSKIGQLSEASHDWLMCGDEAKVKLTFKSAGIEMLHEEIKGHTIRQSRRTEE